MLPLEVLQRAITATAGAISVADAPVPDLPLVYVNPAFEALTGYRAEQVLGRDCRVVQSPQSDRHVRRRLRTELHEGRPVRAVLLNRRPDGVEWCNELELAPVRDGAWVLTHWVGLQRDVTEREREAMRRLAYLDR